MSNPTWDDLGRPARPDAERESSDVARYAELCANVFSGGPGAELMKMMRARYVERRAPAGAPEAILREAEAVRGFIFELERARDRGNDAIAKAKSKPA
jgi:hypothetical protein